MGEESTQRKPSPKGRQPLLKTGGLLPIAEEWGATYSSVLDTSIVVWDQSGVGGTTSVGTLPGVLLLGGGVGSLVRPLPPPRTILVPRGCVEQASTVHQDIVSPRWSLSHRLALT